MISLANQSIIGVVPDVMQNVYFQKSKSSYLPIDSVAAMLKVHSDGFARNRVRIEIMSTAQGFADITTVGVKESGAEVHLFVVCIVDLEDLLAVFP